MPSTVHDLTIDDRYYSAPDVANTPYNAVAWICDVCRLSFDQWSETHAFITGVSISASGNGHAITIDATYHGTKQRYVGFCWPERSMVAQFDVQPAIKELCGQIDRLREDVATLRGVRDKMCGQLDALEQGFKSIENAAVSETTIDEMITTRLSEALSGYTSDDDFDDAVRKVIKELAS